MPFISTIRRNLKRINDQQPEGPKFEIISDADEIVTAGGYTMHVFKNPKDYTLHVSEISKSLNAIALKSGSLPVDYLVIGGGGGGGGTHGGGGGGGGFQYGSASISPNTYPVVVGAGNTNISTYGTTCPNGSPSSFNSVTSAGGGGGASTNSIQNGSAGGSGGGGGANSGAPSWGGSQGGAGNTPSTSPPQGSRGGNGDTSYGSHGSGGGGGASQVGTASNNGTGYGGNGAGGNGSSWPGNGTAYSGGGGGGGHSSNASNAGMPGGSGGGGTGGTEGQAGQTGQSAGGGGGGTGHALNSNSIGAVGLVIVRYLTTSSDRRLKRSIVHIDTLANGIKIYSFKYLWSNDTFVGVIAQDLLDTKFASAVKEIDGFYQVDYNMIEFNPVTLEEYMTETV